MNRNMLAALLLGIAGTGCHNTMNTVDISESGQYNWIQTDAELSRVAHVTRVSKTRVNGHLQAQVDVSNTGTKRQVVQYRFVWLNADNMQVPTPLTTWQRLFIEGGQTSMLQGVAPDPSVTDCRLEMQRVKE